MTRPRFAEDWPALAQVAADLHRTRVESYPALIERGGISAEAAAHAIAVAAAIAADWHAAVAHRAPPESDVSRADRIATLETAAARTRRLADRRAGEASAEGAPLSREAIEAARIRADLPDPLRLALETADYAEAVETLLWWERQPHNIAWLAAANAEARALYRGSPANPA